MRVFERERLNLCVRVLQSEGEGFWEEAVCVDLVVYFSKKWLPRKWDPGLNP
ncbi:phycocyanobilin ferredoxin oxidoreductase-like protein [Corchorus olitorius]|uniref:Phycocyanobilin ferredoxin oxidoreductase-like protein n=1 Tax=Corchorus olitorius TaxID=93759 RepID=A0A1R3GP03_9ROSI|nr:phycocyanobilin ferredoxin oxidoreductase-like protein [Corchorus olitorius]